MVFVPLCLRSCCKSLLSFSIAALLTLICISSAGLLEISETGESVTECEALTRQLDAEKKVSSLGFVCFVKKSDLELAKFSDKREPSLSGCFMPDGLNGLGRPLNL